MTRDQDSSLRDRVGQLFMVGFEGTEVTPALVDWMRRFAWGGVILFGRNVVSTAQLAALTQGLREVAQGDAVGPLLIAVDQEGGRVARLPSPFTAFPSAATVGHTGADVIAFEVGAAIGMELAAVGINMDMAPVLDVLVNPANTVIGDRAFGDDPTLVARLGKGFIGGLHATGVLAVGKHFPGHGATLLDSHLALPVADRTAVQLEACELVPFREAVQADIEAIMTAHVVYPAWDPDRPATLSPTILRGILREDMAFQGVIVSDDLGMTGVAAVLPWQEIPVQALRAGVDLLLICHHQARQEHAYHRVVKAVQDGEVSAAVVDRAVTRIRELKSRLLGLREADIARPTLDSIGSVAHRALAERLRQRLGQGVRTAQTDDA
jgi:beta-N-acetylhexosaminidase